MEDQTIECYNCGRTNPAWAQVCRNCGVVLARVAGGGGSAMTGRFPTDQASLLAVGAGLGAIVLAVLVGVILSGIIPGAPNVAEATPTPTPSVSVSAEPTDGPSVEPSVEPTAEPTVALPGRVTFGFALNTSTREVTEVSDTFDAGDTFAHAISMPEPFGVDAIFEEVIRVEANGELTVVQERTNGELTVSPSASTAGFSVPASNLLNAWGPGTYIFRDYIGGELIAEGSITLV